MKRAATHAESASQPQFWKHAVKLLGQPRSDLASVSASDWTVLVMLLRALVASVLGVAHCHPICAAVAVALQFTIVDRL